MKSITVGTIATLVVIFVGLYQLGVFNSSDVIGVDQTPGKYSVCPSSINIFGDFGLRFASIGTEDPNVCVNVSSDVLSFDVSSGCYRFISIKSDIPYQFQINWSSFPKEGKNLSINYIVTYNKKNIGPLYIPGGFNGTCKYNYVKNHIPRLELADYP